MFTLFDIRTYPGILIKINNMLHRLPSVILRKNCSVLNHDRWKSFRMNKTIKWVIFYNCLLHRTVTIRYVRKCEECFIIQQIFIRKKLKKLTFLIRNFHKNCPFQLNGIANKIIRLFPRPGFVCVNKRLRPSATKL